MTPNDPRFTPPPNPNNPHPPYPYYPPQGLPMPYVPQAIGPSDGDATTIFVLGLVGLVVCGFVAPVAWVKGNTYRATCRVLEVQPNGLATAGWVLGIVGTVFLVVSMLLLAVTLLLGT